MSRTLYPATRRLLKNLAIVAIALAIVLIGLGLNLDRILKDRFESSLTKAIGTTATIQKLHLQPLQGNLQVNGLRIANLPGFTVPTLIKVHDLQLQTKNFGLMGKTLVVDRLQVKGLDLTIEQRQLRNNLVSLLDRLEQQQQSQQVDRRFQIKQATLQNVTATLNVSTLGRQPIQKTIVVPDLTFNNLTSSNVGGLVLSELTRNLVNELLKATRQQDQNRLLQFPLPSGDG